MTKIALTALDGAPMLRLRRALLTSRRVRRALGPGERAALTLVIVAVGMSDLALLGWLGDSVLAGTFTSDARILAELAASLDRKGRLELANSPAVRALDPDAFVRHLRATLLTCRPAGRERDAIARTLSGFASLHRNVRSRGVEALIGESLFSKRPWDRAHAVLSVECLERIPARFIRRVEALLDDRFHFVRGNAWSAVDVLSQRKVFPANALARLRIRAAEARADEDRTTRHNAKLFEARLSDGAPRARIRSADRATG